MKIIDIYIYTYMDELYIGIYPISQPRASCDTR